ASGKVRAPEIEMSEPRVELTIRIGRNLDCLQGVSALQRYDALDDLAVGLRHGGHLGGEAGSSLARFGHCVRLDEDTCREESDLNGIAVCQRFLCSGDRCASASAQLMCIRDGYELSRGLVRIFGSQVCRSALLQRLHCIGQTA